LREGQNTTIKGAVAGGRLKAYSSGLVRAIPSRTKRTMTRIGFFTNFAGLGTLVRIEQFQVTNVDSLSTINDENRNSISGFLNTKPIFSAYSSFSISQLIFRMITAREY
jgi:hypothetical protein